MGIRGQPRKHAKTARRYLTDDQACRLAEAVRDADRATLILVLTYTGFEVKRSPSASEKSTVSALQFHEQTPQVKGKIRVGVPKSWGKRTVPFPAFLDGDQRRPTTTEDSTSWFRSATKRAGLDRLILHDLGHTAVSLAVASGAHVKVMQRMLDHKSAAMTLGTHADTFDRDLDDGAERVDERAAVSADLAMPALGLTA